VLIRGNPWLGFTHSLPPRQGLEEFANVLLQQRVANFRSYFRQRLQYEAPFVQRGMRNSQALAFDRRIPKQQNVNIDAARPLFLRPLSSHLLFDFQNVCHEFRRRLFGFKFDGTIQEPRLSGKFDRLGFVERRDLKNFPQRSKPPNGIPQIAGTIANVRAERQINSVRQSESQLSAPGIQLWTCGGAAADGSFYSMLSIHTKIDRTQRLLRMLEEDAPLLAVRVAPLTEERQQTAKEYAAQLRARTRAELEKLIEQSSFWDSNDRTPQPAD